MTKCYFNLLLCLVIGFSAIAQPSNSVWQNVYGGSNEDAPEEIVFDQQGNALIIGTTNSIDGDVRGKHGGGFAEFNTDLWAVKVDMNNGDTIWTTRALGGMWDESPGLGSLHCIATNDNNYLVTGITQSDDDDIHGKHGGAFYDDIWAIKIDGNTGDTIWTNVLGGTGDDDIIEVIQSADGNYILLGITNSNDGDVVGFHNGLDIWVVKLNETTGDTIWTKALGGSNTDAANTVIQGGDGNYVISGTSNSVDGDVHGYHGGFGLDAWVVKLNQNTGDTLWTKILGGDQYEWSGDLLLLDDNNYLLAVLTNSDNGDVRDYHAGMTCPIGDCTDAWLVKLDANTGDTLWTNAIGGFKDEGQPQFLVNASDGNPLMASVTFSNDGDVNGGYLGSSVTGDYWVAKLDLSSGNIIWATEAFGGDSIEELFHFEETCDKGFLLSGDTYSILPNTGDVTEDIDSAPFGSPLGIWFLKLDSSGNKEWDYTIGDAFGGEKDGRVYERPDGSYVLFSRSANDSAAGDKTVDGKGGVDYWLSKWDFGLEAGFMPSDTFICVGDSIQFTDTSSGNIAGYTWTFSDNSSATTMNANHIYESPGIFHTKLVVSNGCQFDTAFVDIEVIDDSIHLSGFGDTTICYGEELIFLADGGLNYRWLENGVHIDSLNNQINVSPEEHTQYHLVITKNCGIDTLNADVTLISCILFVPNAFSPNSNVSNELFKIIGDGVKNIHLRIFDYRGTKVFDTMNTKTAWDGTYKGQNLPEDAYTYYITGNFSSGGVISKSGTITLLR